MKAQPKKNYVPTAKQKQAADPAHSVWVSANAGSGKTQVLVQRVIRLMLDGVRPDSILSITYTKAAAAEMADRLFAQLSGWTGMTDLELAQTVSNLGADGADPAVLLRARKLFTQALETPGGLKIQTIHAFCERLLHLFPIEAGLSPGFGLLEDRSADELRERAIADVIYGANGGSEISDAFARISNRLNQDQFVQMITDYIAALRKAGPEISSLSFQTFTVLLKKSLGISQSDKAADLRREFMDVDQQQYARHAMALRDYPTHHNANISTQLNSIAVAQNPTEALLAYHFTDKFTLSKRSLSDTMKKDHPDIADFVAHEAARLEPLLQRLMSLELIADNADAFTVATAVLRQIDREKQKSGKVDFDDLIRRTAQLLATSQARDWVTFKLDPGLSHILLDESQDTGPAQWIIINRLAEEFFAGLGVQQPRPRTLFVVGDDKQSIYSFQGADVTAFSDAKEFYVGGGTLQNVTLDISYRSTDEILTAVDKVHTPQGPDQKLLREHTASRRDDKGIVEIWPLEMPAEKPENEPWQKPVDRPPQSSPKRILARKIASRVKAWTDSHKPRKLAGQKRAVAPGDILILFRSRAALFSMVMAELRSAGVPVAGADRLSLLQSLIVQDLLALLNWLLLPQDDHALACVLKSPLVPQPLTEAQLFAAAHGRAASRLLQRLSGPNMQWLTELQNAAVIMAPDQLLAHILTRCRKAISARLGPEALEASDAMLDMAMDYQREGGASLFGFVQWFQSTETTLKREMDKAGGQVRLMTVHGAKGLEAPIVIIADAAQNPFGDNSRPRILEMNTDSGIKIPLWLDGAIKPLSQALEDLKEEAKQRQLSESSRLLYVAMTRAEDELYIGGVANAKTGKADNNSWWPKIAAALGEPQRFGSDDIFLESGLTPEKLTKPMLPDWLTHSPPQEAAQNPLGLNAALSGSKTYDPVAAKRGRARHRLLQDLADVPESLHRALAVKRAARLELTEAEALRLADALSKPELAPYLGEDSRAEVDIYGTLANGRPVQGRLDRLAVRPEGLWLLDYKTGSAPAEEHVAQMAGYVQLLQAADPGKPITAALFFTQSGKLQELTQTQLTAALRKREVPMP